MTPDRIPVSAPTSDLVSHSDVDPVEALMVDCLQAPEDEWPAALEEAARAHPEHAEELRARIGALLRHDSPPRSAPARLELPDAIDDFESFEPIGSGGMGLVYRAHQRPLQRDVALKLIRPERLMYEGSLARFQREVETVARLRHRGIVAIHSVSSAEIGGATLPYFAMELLEGATLADALRQLRDRAPESLRPDDLFGAIGGTGEAPPAFGASWTDACARVALQIAEALEYAHEQGVLHRDVKPSNVALEPDGRAVLFDFGLTVTTERRGARVTATGDPVGTPIYMAPELLAEGAEGDARSDVYALGVTLYELLALQPPFAGDTPLEVERAVATSTADPVRARNRRVPRDLAVVVETAIAHARRDRYDSMAALRQDLERFLERRPIEARPPGPARRSLRWVQRNPAPATSLALAALLIVGVPSFFLWQARVHAAELEEIVEEERAAKLEAAASADELEDVVTFMLGLFERASPEVNGGDVPDAREMLHLGAAEIDALGARSRARVELALGTLFGVLTEPAAAQPHLDEAAEYYAAREDEGSRARHAEALRLAGHNLLFLRRLDEAAERAERALEVARVFYGEPAPKLAGFYATLADVRGAERDLDGAVEARRLALAQVDGLAPDDPRPARCRALLGVALKERGDLGEARPILEAALAWNDARPEGAPDLGSERELVLLVLGDLLKLEGDLEGALAKAREARAALVETRGEDSLMTQQAAMAEAEALARLGRHAEALPQLESLAASMVLRVPETHPVVLRVRLMQLACLGALGRYPEVAPLCEATDLHASYVETFGPAHENTRRVVRSRAISHQTRDEGPESLEWLAKLEQAEREAAEWSGDHADAIFMLVAQRMAQGGLEIEESRALLTALLAAVEGTGLEALAAIGGHEYDVETTARQFLAGLPR